MILDFFYQCLFSFLHSTFCFQEDTGDLTIASSTLLLNADISFNIQVTRNQNPNYPLQGKGHFTLTTSQNTIFNYIHEKYLNK